MKNNLKTNKERRYKKKIKIKKLYKITYKTHNNNNNTDTLIIKLQNFNLPKLR